MFETGSCLVIGSDLAAKTVLGYTNMDNTEKKTNERQKTLARFTYAKLRL
jgi:hypothetical protein